jgi:beta-galactosidase
MLMEQTPSSQNWQTVNALKRPGQMRLWSYLAVAHGADSVMYFQWRRGRGGREMLHGAIVAHAGHQNTRVFREVSRLGAELDRLEDRVLGAGVEARVALIFDWQNWWTLDCTSGPVREKRYRETVLKHYRAFWERNVPVHVVGTDADLAPYDIVVAPMLYMTRPGWGEKVTDFVRSGGRFVATFLSGWVDEDGLAHLGGYPGPLRGLLGVWVEEIDALFEDQTNRIVLERALGPCAGEYECRRLCELAHAETAEVLATYGEDFYAGRPVLTENAVGEGRAYYIGADVEGRFLTDFYAKLCADCSISPVLETPGGVEVRRRSQNDRSFLFVLNHNDEPSRVNLGEGPYTDMLTGETRAGELPLEPFDVRILQEAP